MHRADGVTAVILALAAVCPAQNSASGEQETIRLLGSAG
jgi:hypothetical protein